MQTETPSPAPEGRATVRTYKYREDAEHARKALADSDISALVQEHFIPDRFTGARTSLGCSLTVPASSVTDAARVLLRLPPADSAARKAQTEGTASTTSSLSSSSGGSRLRLRRRDGERGFKQRSALWILLVALGCSAVVMVLFVHWILNLRDGRAAAGSGPDAENYIAFDDVNGDGLADLEREYTPDGRVLLQIREDRDGDGKFDLRWIWQRGVLAYRDRDIDLNGVMDERTTYDGADRPFYVDLRPNGEGPVIKRTVYREGVLWKILEDRDADNHFDFIREYSPDGGRLLREETLPKGSPENDVPKPVPLPPAEESEPDAGRSAASDKTHIPPNE